MPTIKLSEIDDGKTITVNACQICGKSTEGMGIYICKECKTRLYKMLYYYDDPQLVKNRVYGLG